MGTPLAFWAINPLSQLELSLQEGRLARNTSLSSVVTTFRTPKDYYQILGVPRNARRVTDGQLGDILIRVRVR